MTKLKSALKNFFTRKGNTAQKMTKLASKENFNLAKDALSTSWEALNDLSLKDPVKVNGKKNLPRTFAKNLNNKIKNNEHNDVINVIRTTNEVVASAKKTNRKGSEVNLNERLNRNRNENDYIRLKKAKSTADLLSNDSIYNRQKLIKNQIGQSKNRGRLAESKKTSKSFNNLYNAVYRDEVPNIATDDNNNEIKNKNKSRLDALITRAQKEMKLKNYPMAINFLVQANNFLEESKETSESSASAPNRCDNIKCHIASAYALQGQNIMENSSWNSNCNDIIELLKIAEDYIPKKNLDKRCKQLAMCVYSILGDTYMKIRKLDSANEYFNKTLTFAKSLNEVDYMTKSLMNIGKLYSIRCQYDRANYYLEFALKSAKNKYQKTGIYKQLVGNYMELNSFNLANKNARAYLELANELDLIEHQTYAFYYLSLISKKLNNIDDAKK